jgi:hypothetical protein
VSAVVETPETEGVADVEEQELAVFGNAEWGSNGVTESPPDIPKTIAEAEVGVPESLIVRVSEVSELDAVPYHST